MKTRIRTLFASAILLAGAGAGLAAILNGCDTEPAGAAAAGAEPAARVPAGAPLADFQSRLLDLAFEAASKFPADPHLKNRSRAQAEVVSACLALDQPGRAATLTGRIEGWRRGAAHAELAFHLAGRGDSADVRRHLDLAREAAEAAGRDESAQEWRADRIRSGIARTLARLGDAGEAGRIEAALAGAEAGRTAAVMAAALDPSAFESQMQALEVECALFDFDRTQRALEACVQLFGRFHGDPVRRARVEGRIRSALERVPVPVRLQTLGAMAAIAIDHEDRAGAGKLVAEAALALESGTWLPEDRIPQLARLAALRHRAGETEASRRDLEGALKAYAAQRDRIVDIWRAGALRPVAEAWAAIGDAATAREVYTRAVEEGALNPNSRPRADDVVATCCSMAVQALDPGPELSARIIKIVGRLGEPW